MYDLGYDDLLATITDRFGITVDCFNSGGGCLIWETRLETGDWMWVTDWDAGIQPLARRLELEAQGITVGWHIGIYANLTDSAGDQPDSCTRLAGVEHHTATAAQLPDLIDLALRGTPRNEQHEFGANGTHTISYGIRYY
jgi:hypothetical protein